MACQHVLPGCGRIVAALCTIVSRASYVVLESSCSHMRASVERLIESMAPIYDEFRAEIL